MKKAVLGILSAAIVLSLCAATAFAAYPCGRHHRSTASSRCAYVDSNGDGVCDVCGVKHANCLSGKGTCFVDSNGDGICDNCGSYHRCGEWFVDADGDGICDHYGTGWGCSHGYGRGYGHGCHR